ncbi:MAG TPA: anti-sigma factor [Steroidobacteraceae bacterium]|nr:anti-sigma factor [Steroidobacteraceae bacterium]
MKSANRELVDRLAAEYVLGTLRGRARRRFERWLVSPQVGSLVKAWEVRLAGLEPSMESVTPPPSVWRGIEDKLDLRRKQRQPALRWLKVAAAAAFFGVVGWFAVRQYVNPPEVQQPQLASTERAFLQSTDAKTIYWRVEVLGDSQELSLHVHAVHDLPAGKSHELWALPEGGKPVSLGLMPHTGDHHRVLTAAQRAALARSKQVAVSLESEGGSPTGAPTVVLLAAPLAMVSVGESGERVSG